MRLSEILHQEHKRTLVVLDELDGWRGKPCPTDLSEISKLLNDLIDVAQSDITDHYAFEEGHLFPILRQNGAEFMTNMLAGEHAIIRPIAQNVSKLAQAALKDGFTEESWTEFLESSFDFIGHETFHIQKEEMGLINALNNLLTPEDEAPLIEIYKSGEQ
ncbi:hemerythrin domain-containing protein [Terasakiella sp. A23]|uniref:hemerythrin domain-containing protein n=1 Tax=Terasakiella sp. FCG-A23 TaxID=3080561 RepID=UPI002952FDDF|nr:hemerythrin domain-containing protein [Terasakiella sp. A23]MDV7339560.1 hemerythrin domain-containing protein [Terasakiella sp. A23]